MLIVNLGDEFDKERFPSAANMELLHPVAIEIVFTNLPSPVNCGMSRELQNELLAGRSSFLQAGRDFHEQK